MKNVLRNNDNLTTATLRSLVLVSRFLGLITLHRSAVNLKVNRCMFLKYSTLFDSIQSHILLTFKARIPASVLECSVVAREINFATSEEIKNLRLIQKVLMHDYCIEEWVFNFGYVIPNSANTWQQTIKAAGKDHMMSAEVLSGNITIDTSFYDGEVLVHKCVVRVYYV